MAEVIIQVTKEELRAIVEESVERKLIELLGDPEEGLDLRDAVRARLQRQQAAVAAGERGQTFSNVVERLGLE